MLIHKSRKTLDLKQYQGKQAKVSDCPEFLDKDAQIFIDGKLAIAYFHSLKDEKLETLRRSLFSIKYETSTRTGGMVTTSRIFGYSPRNALRNLSCRSTSLAAAQPSQHAVLCSAAALVEEKYKEVNPELHKSHMRQTQEKVLKSYRMGETCFTSGIANDCNPLRYHFDSGNYAGVWSGMFVLKSDVQGGHLAVPELDIVIDCADKSLLLFDGQGLLHGVTPIVKTKETGRRFSVVYYSLRQMWNCLETKDELDRIRESRMEIEKKRKFSNQTPKI